MARRVGFGDDGGAELRARDRAAARAGAAAQLLALGGAALWALERAGGLGAAGDLLTVALAGGGAWPAAAQALAEALIPPALLGGAAAAVAAAAARAARIARLEAAWAAGGREARAAEAAYAGLLRRPAEGAGFGAARETARAQQREVWPLLAFLLIWTGSILAVAAAAEGGWLRAVWLTPALIGWALAHRETRRLLSGRARPRRRSRWFGPLEAPPPPPTRPRLPAAGGPPPGAGPIRPAGRLWLWRTRAVAAAAALFVAWAAIRLAAASAEGAGPLETGERLLAPLILGVLGVSAVSWAFLIGRMLQIGRDRARALEGAGPARRAEIERAAEAALDDLRRRNPQHEGRE